MHKVKVYLDHGVREVWQVYARTQQVFVHTGGQNVCKFVEGSNLTTEFLPDFELGLSGLFTE